MKLAECFAVLVACVFVFYFSAAPESAAAGRGEIISARMMGSHDQGMGRKTGGVCCDWNRWKLPPAADIDKLPEPGSDRAKLYVRYCMQCHGLFTPKTHSADEWPDVVERMLERASIHEYWADGGTGTTRVETPSKREKETIISYLKDNAMRSMKADLLPSPASVGAQSFSESCSVCHDLPDIKLHTAGEWPDVVENMIRISEKMEKPHITPQDKKEIIDYLKKHARRSVR